MTDLSRARWRKAARSGPDNGGCVEVTVNLPGLTAIRDSKDPGGGAHVLTPRAFAALLTDIKRGRLGL